LKSKSNVVRFIGLLVATRIRDHKFRTPHIP